MKSGFYFKLAASNIRKNSRTYIPYIITCILTVMMFYIMKSLSLNPGINNIMGSTSLYMILDLGTIVIAIFSAIFLFYTNSFLIKNRKKEFGVFNILGMEKRHLTAVIFIENLYITFITLILGIGCGIILDKLMFLSFSKLIGSEAVPGFFISKDAIFTTVIVFCVIYMMILFKAVFTIRLSNPIELLRGGKVGEKEPKAKWFTAILGLISVGIGYYISITTSNPLSAITLFFFAVLLVIYGTYMLFTAGSITFLKLLRKNKRYYYKTNHFISVSGMIYRMKQNAVGLANICILSTMVLVMVSSTSSLIIGMEEILDYQYPHDYSILFYHCSSDDFEKLIEDIHSFQKEKNFEPENENIYSELFIVCKQQGNAFLTGYDDPEFEFSENYTNIDPVGFITLDYYNELSGENKTLEDGNVLMYSSKGEFEYPTVKVLGKKFGISKNIHEIDSLVKDSVFDYHYIVVKDDNVLKELDSAVSNYSGMDNNVSYYYEFDSNLKDNEQLELFNELNKKYQDYRNDGRMTIMNQAEGRESYISLYGGLFFLGMFLGTLFTIANVLIIYYKQISEGFDDRERFSIMKKVGLSHEEIKSTIHSQILTVFFMPLIVAGIHLAAAFPLITKLLFILSMNDTKLFAYCTIGSFLAFAAVYVLIYFMTARVYYKLVSSEK